MDTALIRTIYKIDRDGLEITSDPDTTYAAGKELVYAHEQIEIIITPVTRGGVLAMATSTPLMWPSMFETGRKLSYQAYRCHPRTVRPRQGFLPIPGETETYLYNNITMMPISAENIVRDFVFGKHSINTGAQSSIVITYGGLDNIPVTIVDVFGEHRFTLMVTYTSEPTRYGSDPESYINKTLHPAQVDYDDIYYTGIITPFI